MINPQGLKNRLKLSFWALLSSLKYIFQHNQNKKNSIVCLVGAIPSSCIDWYNSSQSFRNLRYEVHKLDELPSYWCYFIEGAEFRQWELGENCYMVEFPNSLQGMKQYFEFIKDINPKFLKIHDLVGNFFVDLVVSKFFKLKTVVSPRGMNYYWDFVFRKEGLRYKEGLIGWIRKHLNLFCYKWTLRHSDMVIASPILALEAELLRRKPVYTSNYLLGIGSMAVIMSENLPITEHWQQVYEEKIAKYQHKLFTFNRVEKMKVGSIIEDYLAIQDKINGSSCLVMIGSGADLKWFENTYKQYENIIFLGFIDREEAFPLIKKLDLFIAPQGGNAVVEVGLLGIPVIAYNIDNMTYYISHRVNGYLVDWKTPKDFQDILLEHFDLSEQERNDMKDMTKKTYQLQFNKSSFLRDRKNYVRKILAL